MNFFLKILFSILPLACFCQQNIYNKLNQALGLAATDSARFHIMAELESKYTDNNYDSALYYAQKSITLAEKNNRELNVARLLDNEGYDLMHLGRLSESFQSLTRALQIATNPENEKKIWNTRPNTSPGRFRLFILESIHHDLGHLMGAAGETDQQIIQYNETRKMARAIGDTIMLGFVSMNLGNVYLTKKKNLDSALQMERAAEQYFLQKGDRRYLGHVYALMGNVYEEKNNNGTAQAYFYKGAEVAAELKNLLVLAENYDELTDFYLHKEKNTDSALFYAKKALNVRQSLGGQYLGSSYNNLSRAYALNNNQDSAYKYQGLALVAKDSSYEEHINSLTNIQKLSFEEQFRLQKLEKEKIEMQNKIRTYSFLIGIGILLLVLFLFYRNNVNRKKANKVLQKQKEKVEQTLQELKSTQAQLVQQEKMASLGELTAGIAHEIQNPLNFVNNFSEVNRELADELKSELASGNMQQAKEIADDIRDNSDKITHHGKRADAIVKGMLQHSRTASGQKEPTDINALADEYLRLAYHGLRAKDKSFNAKFETDFDKSIGKINVVPQDIGRVLLNLINNAFYAVTEKKNQLDRTYEPKVVVSTKVIKPPLGGLGAVEVKVTDNGNGIPQKILDKIFQPFFTTKPTGQGTGLGLSLSYDIVRAHGGEMRVDTREGVGSEFIIQLPFK